MGMLGSAAPGRGLANMPGNRPLFPNPHGPHAHLPSMPAPGAQAEQGEVGGGTGPRHACRGGGQPHAHLVRALPGAARPGRGCALLSRHCTGGLVAGCMPSAGQQHVLGNPRQLPAVPLAAPAKHTCAMLCLPPRHACRYADKANMEVGLLFTCRLGDVDLDRPVGEHGWGAAHLRAQPASQRSTQAAECRPAAQAAWRPVTAAVRLRARHSQRCTARQSPSGPGPMSLRRTHCMGALGRTLPQLTFPMACLQWITPFTQRSSAPSCPPSPRPADQEGTGGRPDNHGGHAHGAADAGAAGPGARPPPLPAATPASSPCVPMGFVASQRRAFLARRAVLSLHRSLSTSSVCCAAGPA